MESYLGLLVSSLDKVPKVNPWSKQPRRRET